MAIDYAAIAKELGGTAVEPLLVETSGLAIFAEDKRAPSVVAPAGYKLLSITLNDARPPDTYYDVTQNAVFTPAAPAPLAQTEIPPTQPIPQVDLAALAAEFGGTAMEEPSTTATGLAGAVTRGLALPAAGAALGAALGAPFAGVGAIPGAIAGAGAATLAGLVGDPIVSSINNLLGTQFTLPTEAMEALLTELGVAEPRTAAERIVQTTTAGASGSIGGIAAGKALEIAGMIPVGKVKGLLEEGSAVTKEVGRLLANTPALQTVVGGTSAAAGGVAKESGAGTVGQIAAQAAGALVPSVPAAVKTLTGQAAKLIAPAGAEIREQLTPVTIEQLRLGYTPPAAPTVRGSLQSIKATVGEKISPQDAATLKKVITQNPDSIDTVNFRVAGTQVVPDNLAANTIKQGWKEGAIASIKAATAKDRQSMTKMLNLFKIGEKNERMRTLNRPSQILGDTVVARIDFLDKANKSSGKAIDRIAQTKLRGQSVNYAPAINKFLDDLSKIGVKVELDANGVAKANLQGSRIEGDAGAEKLLNVVLRRFSKTEAPDALGVHDAKRYLDTQVEYGKRNLNNPLTATAENIVKGLRRNLNKTLGEKFPVYKAANEKYSDTIKALDELQKAAGTQINFDSENANKALGVAMRKLTSNIGTRTNLIDALDQANSTSTKYGLKLDDDIISQVIFINELDRMFGAAAQTSLKGQVAEGALGTGIDIARGRVAQRAFDLLAEGAENLRGINKDNAVKAMEELLNRK